MRGYLLLELGRYQESLDEAEAILQAAEPETVDECQGHILAGGCLRNLGDHAKSGQHLRRALSLSQELLGDHHLLTVAAMGALASTLDGQGELDAARKLQDEILEVMRGVFGDEPPDTLDNGE